MGAPQLSRSIPDQGIQKLDTNRLGRLEVGEGYIGDLLYDRYRAMVTDNPNTEDDFGNFIPEEFRKAEDDFKNWVGSKEIWDYIERRKKQNRNLPKTIVDLYDARETLKPYWAMYDSIWREGSWQHNLMLNYNQAKTKLSKERFKRDYPRIKFLLKQQDARRRAWRLANPDGDAALVRFYDYNPVKRKGGL